MFNTLTLWAGTTVLAFVIGLGSGYRIEKAFVAEAISKQRATYETAIVSANTALAKSNEDNILLDKKLQELKDAKIRPDCRIDKSLARKLQ